MPRGIIRAIKSALAEIVGAAPDPYAAVHGDVPAIPPSARFSPFAGAADRGVLSRIGAPVPSDTNAGRRRLGVEAAATGDVGDACVLFSHRGGGYN